MPPTSPANCSPNLHSTQTVCFSIDNAFELCVQEIERQVQAAIEEGFVPHGSLAHSFAPGKLTCFMTQTMVKLVNTPAASTAPNTIERCFPG